MDSTYAPQSPDLSSFLSSSAKSKQPYQTSQSVPYAPQSPVLSSFNSNPSQHGQNHHYSSHQSHSQYQNHASRPNFGFGAGADLSEYGTSSYMPPIPTLPETHSSFVAPQSNTTAAYYAQRNIKAEEPYDHKLKSFDGADDHYVTSPTMSRPTPSSSSTTFGAPAKQAQIKTPNPNNIEIKTKFPVARIKRIMQADEEVGKVAQVTPVAVSKALELFMISLVSGAAEKAKETGGKRVTAQHLKMVVQADEQFDFLSEIVGKVADGVEAGGDGKKRKMKNDMDSDSEEEKKARKGKGRRKKGDD